MNCEKCKNKKATVFYADDSGGQHALCAACAQTLSKLTHHPSSSDGDGALAQFAPSSSLFSLCNESNDTFPLPYSEDDASSQSKCPFCSTTLSVMSRTGRAGCPDCYTVFGESIFPSTLCAENALGARMPKTRRNSIERRRNIAALKQRLRTCVEAEDFELAATLRDEIKKLEAHT